MVIKSGWYIVFSFFRFVLVVVKWFCMLVSKGVVFWNCDCSNCC